MNSWDKFCLELAEFWAQRSKDPSSQVAAVIFNDLKQQLGSGWNGFARGIPDRPEDYANKDLKYEMVVHAEINAILNSIGSVRGCTLYSTHFPCPRCASVIIQVGIKKVVCASKPEFEERYADKFAISRRMFVQAGIAVVQM